MFKLVNVRGNVRYAQEIHLLDRECFPDDYWSFELIKKELTDGKDIYFVYTDGKETLAYLNASCVADTAELNRIAVNPLYRRKGIAGMMLNLLADYLKSSGYIRLLLEVRSQNKGAIALYKKYGFISDTVRKNYYQNPSDDAVLMSLEL